MEFKAWRLGRVILLFGFLLQVGTCLKFTAIVPKLLYYDSVTVASISAVDVESHQPAEVNLTYTGARNRSLILRSTTLTFSSDGSQTWDVVFSWDELQLHRESFVKLVMSRSSDKEEMTIPFAKNFGYIFIQTDKPIYTPRDTVKYRVIAVDENQRQAKYRIKVDIKNHTQRIVDEEVMTSDEAFRTHEFKLPKETQPGNWTISASFIGVDNTTSGGHMVSFEVREYVLPKFFFDYEIRPDVITKTTKTITINGTARYFFDKAVQGNVELQLGKWDAADGTKIYMGHNYNIPLVNRSFRKEIPVDSQLQEPLNSDLDTRLYVKLSITEYPTGDIDVYNDTSTAFTYADYVVDFKRSKTTFKPGFPYTLLLHVSKKEGTLNPFLELNITAQFTGFGKSFYKDTGIFKLDGQGKFERNYSFIPDTNGISFLVTLPAQPESKGYRHQVTKYASKNNQYIHIEYHASKKKGEASYVHLNYTKPSFSDKNVMSKPDKITVLVLSKGHIVFTTSEDRKQIGHSYVTLPPNFSEKISPRMRIVAYYVLTDSEYVIDSLIVDTKHVCVEEIYLSNPMGTGVRSGLYKPSDNYTLIIDGSKNMRVGLVAVDKAVLHLNDHQSLTRDSMFAQFNTHDSGSASGDGEKMEDILSNSGLKHMSLTVESKDDHMMSAIFSSMISSSSLKNLVGFGKSTMRDVLHQPTTHQTVRPQTARHNFPEAWLFNETYLGNDTTKSLILKLPDSTTTWSFMAVGLSADRGVCVSHTLEQHVIKLFFADMRVPYKVKRLEEVTLSITIYNYNIFKIKVKGKVHGSAGLCFSANSEVGSSQDGTSFEIDIEPDKPEVKKIKVIPLRKGDLSIIVDLKSQNGEDILEKKLHVVAEGRRVKKSITFVLDPEGKHAAIEPKKKKKKTFSETINNVYDAQNKTQQTTIDLALPVEVITGTEFCHISAFGDLMGDIINHSVMKSRNLIDSPLMNAEKVLGDLAPTVYALLYANISGLMDDTLKEKGRVFVKQGVEKLLASMLSSHSFALNPKSKPATWLTAFVLKTLCHASSLEFIDREKLIDKGFNWLSNQLDENGTLIEQDWRVSMDSLENRIMLSAEVLIAMLECQNVDKVQHLKLRGTLSSFLEDHFEQIKVPMVLAKVTYALMLDDKSSEEYKDALKKLDKMKNKNAQGHQYWSNNVEADESIPLWYHKGAHASAVEATAYALIVYVNNSDPNADAIADWLVGQRNQNGAFIGAMDSTVAIQALAKYSLQKHGVKVDLHCNVSSDRLSEYFHSFKFTEKNATHSESLNNVPVGEVLEVITKGQGLGQMQVNVEYNVPIEKNAQCTFNINVTATKAETQSISNSPGNAICAACKTGCSNDKAVKIKLKMNRASALRACKSKGPPYSEGTFCKKLQKTNKKKPGKKTDKPKKIKRNNRQARSANRNQAFSKKIICINACLQYKKRGLAGRTHVQIEMLSGYTPFPDDIDRITEMPNVEFAMYDNITEVLRVQFNQISCKKKTCVTFRASADASVDRLMPAVTEVTQEGTAAPQCVIEYNPPAGEESLQIFCANMTNWNKGECTCLSGLCSQCKPILGNKINFFEELVCRSKIVYKLHIEKVRGEDNWAEIEARVISLNKTGIDNITVGSSIKLTTPHFCHCPRTFSSKNVYLLSADPEKFVDGKGRKNVFRYMLNEKSVFLNMEEDNNGKSSLLTVPHSDLHRALSDSKNCPKD